MDSLVLLSWLAYLLCGFLLLLASWKLLYWLPFSLKCSIFLSQLAILAIPAPVIETALAPAFIVVILDILSGVPTSVWVEKALPLFLALIAAWPLGFAWGWVKRMKEANQSTQQAAEKKESDVNP
ncbi:hypothetical protein [Marinospirillum sp.]|uniref:hypothetical protein n=1 Tax=Marinospirillum sp. TaxID=2183934 RepID=UPI00384B3B3C